MTEPEPSSPDQVARFHLLVGEIVRTWATFESTLWLIVQALLGIDQFRARIIMASLPNLRAQREFIIRLGETYLDDSVLPHFRSLMRRIKKLAARRNALAHSPMSHENNETYRIFRDVFNIEQDGGLGFSSDKISNKEIAQLIAAIQTLQSDVIQFMVMVNGKIHSSARIHREPPKRPIL